MEAKKWREGRGEEWRGEGVAGSSPCERELELRGLGALLKATREVISVSRRLECHELTSLALVLAETTTSF